MKMVTKRCPVHFMGCNGDTIQVPTTMLLPHTVGNLSFVRTYLKAVIDQIKSAFQLELDTVRTET